MELDIEWRIYECYGSITQFARENGKKSSNRHVMYRTNWIFKIQNKKAGINEWVLEQSLNGGFTNEGFWSKFNRFNKCFGSTHNFQEKNGKKCTEVQTKLDLFKASRNEWMVFGI